MSSTIEPISLGKSQFKDAVMFILQALFKSPIVVGGCILLIAWIGSIEAGRADGEPLFSAEKVANTCVIFLCFLFQPVTVAYLMSKQAYGWSWREFKQDMDRTTYTVILKLVMLMSVPLIPAAVVMLFFVSETESVKNAIELSDHSHPKGQSSLVSVIMASMFMLCHFIIQQIITALGMKHINSLFHYFCLAVMRNKPVFALSVVVLSLCKWLSESNSLLIFAMFLITMLWNYILFSGKHPKKEKKQVATSIKEMAPAKT